MHARAGRLALNARMTDVRATQLLAALPEGNFILILKFLRENDDDSVLEGKSDPANLAPLRDGDLNCMAQRVVEHFEGVLRGQGLTPTRRQKIQGWEERVHESGATVDDVAELEKILKRAIVLRDIAGVDIYNSGKYQRGGNGVWGKVELIVHNGHAWSKDLHFPQSREVHFYKSDVWHAIREATR